MTNDQLNQAIRTHATFQNTARCAEEAWDEARDQMPAHLTDAVIGWFIDTRRYDTVFDDWCLDGDDRADPPPRDPTQAPPTKPGLDLRRYDTPSSD